MHSEPSGGEGKREREEEGREREMKERERGRKGGREDKYARKINNCENNNHLNAYQGLMGVYCNQIRAHQLKEFW